MSPGRERRPAPDPVDGVYEIELDDESPEDALREAMAAAEESASRAAGATADRGDGEEGAEPAPGTELLVMREKYLRALADFDNYRKRVDRERAEASRAALVEPLRAFLGVVDNLDRALAAGGSLDDLKSGVELILRQTGDLLRRFGVEEVPSLGHPFDPAFHEAVVRYEDAAVDVPMVSQQFQKGYRYQGRLLRPAMVKVAVPRDGGGPTIGGGDGDAS